MTQEEKAKYFRIALNICQFGFDDQQTDLMIRLYDLICEKKGKADVDSILKIKHENKEAFAKKEEPGSDKT